MYEYRYWYCIEHRSVAYPVSTHSIRDPVRCALDAQILFTALLLNLDLIRISGA